MTVAASFGSNLFNLCISLSLPWLFSYLSTGQPVILSNQRLIAAATLTLLLALFIAISIFYHGMLLRRSLGAIFIVVYVATMTSVGVMLLMPPNTTTTSHPAPASNSSRLGAT